MCYQNTKGRPEGGEQGGSWWWRRPHLLYRFKSFTSRLKIPQLNRNLHISDSRALSIFLSFQCVCFLSACVAFNAQICCAYIQHWHQNLLGYHHVSAATVPSQVDSD